MKKPSLRYIWVGDGQIVSDNKGKVAQPKVQEVCKLQLFIATKMVTSYEQLRFCKSNANHSDWTPCYQYSTTPRLLK